DKKTILSYLAIIYNIRGEYSKAKQLMEQLYDAGSPFVGYDFILHQSYLGLNMLDEAEKVENIAQIKVENTKIPTNVKYLKRMIAERNYHIGNLFVAKQKFEEILDISINDKQLNWIFKSYSEIIKIQLDLFQLQPSNQTLKNELFSLINTLQQLTDDQGMIVASIETSLIGADLLISENLLEDAEIRTNKALQLAKEYDYSNLIEKTLTKLDIIKQIKYGKTGTKEQNEGIFSRIKQAATNLLRIQPTGNLKEQQVDVHGIIIIGEGGINIFDYYFDTKLSSEPSLISGLISAVSSFMGEISRGNGYLKSIGHDDMNLILEPIGELLLVCIASDETFDLRDKTRRFADKMKTLIGKENDVSARISNELINNLNNITEQVYITK
ncbi:MAG: hypothetical protein OEY49_20130, partial [Candidatus Heimdallarchaeota archaeon]|nr:hypothetical protein [Candidatus Heimdallarchaeota archaeon]